MLHQLTMASSATVQYCWKLYTHDVWDWPGHGSASSDTALSFQFTSLYRSSTDHINLHHASCAKNHRTYWLQLIKSRFCMASTRQRRNSWASSCL